MSHSTHSAWRSWLYVPGSRDDRIAKAISGDADCVIIDLEDAVAPAHKAEARANAVATVTSPQPKPVLVRINASGTTWQQEDIAALKGAEHLSGVRVPKAENAAQVVALAEQLPHTPLHLLIESAKGLQRSDDLALAHPNVASIALGEADLRADLGITDDAHLSYARGRVVASAAAAGLPAPPQSVFTQLDDEEGLRESTKRAKAAGFFGRTVIHPKQVDVVNEVFLPTNDAVTDARALIDSLDDATAALVLPDGRFVDPAIVRHAQRVLDLAARYGTNTGGNS